MRKPKTKGDPTRYRLTSVGILEYFNELHRRFEPVDCPLEMHFCTTECKYLDPSGPKIKVWCAGKDGIELEGE